MRRRRGMSLLEVIFASGLASMFIVFLGRVVWLTFQWRATTSEVARSVERGERLRAALGEALRSAHPIPALTIGATGEISEGRGQGTVYEAPRSLVLRAYDEYWVIEQSGKKLVRRRIGRDGVAVVDVLADQVESVRMGDGEAGLEWRVRFASGEEAKGFVAARVDLAPPRPIAAPPLAPRWGGRR